MQQSGPFAELFTFQQALINIITDSAEDNTDQKYNLQVGGTWYTGTITHIVIRALDSKQHAGGSYT